MRYLTDPEGKPSTMRMMSFIALFAAIAFGSLTLLYPTASSDMNGIYLTTAFLISAFAPKSLQRFVETSRLQRSREDHV